MDKQIYSKFKILYYVGVMDLVYYKYVIDGMQLCMEGGMVICFWVRDIIICGKIGIVQNFYGKDYVVFFVFVLCENFQIVIVCIVENVGFGGIWSVFIVILMIEKYFKGKIDWLELEKWMMEVILIEESFLVV